MHDSGLVPTLRPFLGHWHNRVKATCIVSLRQLGFSAVQGPLRTMLSHADPGVRLSARWAVGKLYAMVRRPAGPTPVTEVEEIDWKELGRARRSAKEKAHAATN